MLANFKHSTLLFIIFIGLVIFVSNALKLDLSKNTELKPSEDDDYNIKFNKLKDEYIAICKEISEIQSQLNFYLSPKIFY